MELAQPGRRKGLTMPYILFAFWFSPLLIMNALVSPPVRRPVLVLIRGGRK